MLDCSRHFDRVLGAGPAGADGAGGARGGAGRAAGRGGAARPALRARSVDRLALHDRRDDRQQRVRRAVAGVRDARRTTCWRWTCCWPTARGPRRGAGRAAVAALDERLRALVERHGDAIRRELGRFPRQVSGYALQHLLPENGFDVAQGAGRLRGHARRGARRRGAAGAGAAGPGAGGGRVPGHGRRPPPTCRACCRMQPSAIEGSGAELADCGRRGVSGPLPSSLPAGGGWLFIETTRFAGRGGRPRPLAGAHADPGGRRSRPSSVSCGGSGRTARGSRRGRRPAPRRGRGSRTRRCRRSGWRTTCADSRR